MKSVKCWLEEYSFSHQNSVNILIHKVCVPLIVACILGFLWFLSTYLLSFVVGCVLIFYGFLSVRLCLGFLVELVVMLFGLYLLKLYFYEQMFSCLCVVFFVSWVFQFVGHLIEGVKPSFFKDIQFLLIGPLWTLSLIYKKLKLKF